MAKRVTGLVWLSHPAAALAVPEVLLTRKGGGGGRAAGQAAVRHGAHGCPSGAGCPSPLLQGSSPGKDAGGNVENWFLNRGSDLVIEDTIQCPPPLMLTVNTYVALSVSGSSLGALHIFNPHVNFVR